MPITDLLERNAALYGNDTALVELNPEVQERRRVTWKEYQLIEPSTSAIYRREITWRVFDEKANRCANLLLSRGIGPGKKVAILMMNCLEWLPIYFGILKTGAVVVPFNYRYTSEEVKYCLDLAEVDVLFFGPEFIGRMEEICDIIPRVSMLFFVGEGCPSFAESYDLHASNHPSSSPGVHLSDDQDGAIYFSSGTTGFPKAILHKHRSLTHACAAEQKHHGQSRDDIFLCIPPLYHTGAKMHWFGSLLVGGKAVLLRGVDPKWIMEAVSQEGCTIVWLLVPWGQDILDAFDRGDINPADYQTAQWRLMHMGAQPVPPSLIRRWKAVFPHHEYDTNYGLSESIGPGCVHLGVENIHKVGSIGQAGYGWETKVVDEAGNTVAKGEVGELAVRGPGVMTCYYRDAEATDAVLKDGWLWTGDMAQEDEDGFLFLVDRKKDVIISGGENLYPVQIEDFIRAHSAVKDVAVIGLPHKRLGEVAAAIVELKPGYQCTAEEMSEYCTGLPRYKRPAQVIFAPVPRNATGKIEKPRLRREYGADRVVALQNNG